MIGSVASEHAHDSNWPLPDPSELSVNSFMIVNEARTAAHASFYTVRTAVYAGALLGRLLENTHKHPEISTTYLAAAESHGRAKKITDPFDTFFDYAKTDEAQCLAWGIRETLHANMRRTGRIVTADKAMQLTGYTYRHLIKAGVLGFSPNDDIVVNTENIVSKETWYHQGFTEAEKAPRPVKFIDPIEAHDLLGFSYANISRAFSNDRPPSFRITPGGESRYAEADILALRDFGKEHQFTLHKATREYAKKFPFRHLIVRGQFERYLDYAARRERLTADFIGGLLNVHSDWINRSGNFTPSVSRMTRSIEDVRRGILWTRPDGFKQDATRPES